MLAVVMAWPRSMAYLEVVWRALVASLLCVAVDGCGVFSFACFAQGMTALWLWRCTACMAVYVSFTRLLDGPFTWPYPCPWSIGLSSLSGVGLPCNFDKTRSLLVLFRCLACLGIAGALSASASTCAGPPWLCVRTFAAIGGTALAIRWLLCGIAPSSRYLVQQDVKPLDVHAKPSCQGTRALRDLRLITRCLWPIRPSPLHARLATSQRFLHQDMRAFLRLLYLALQVIRSPFIHRGFHALAWLNRAYLALTYTRLILLHVVEMRPNRPSLASLASLRLGLQVTPFGPSCMS
ncbi:hypothetical protein V6N12_073754 [Hibiscus sabdariffa]|uniref:Uncharacterized protein n=1 Tax=Hibiscus sabdariffa TaxID=183260 RepID=A0ABR2CTD5_9ROSI